MSPTAQFSLSRMDEMLNNCPTLARDGGFFEKRQERAPEQPGSSLGVTGQDRASGCPALSSIHLQPGTQTGPACGAGSTPALALALILAKPGGRLRSGGAVMLPVVGTESDREEQRDT